MYSKSMDTRLGRSRLVVVLVFRLINTHIERIVLATEDYYGDKQS